MLGQGRQRCHDIETATSSQQVVQSYRSSSESTVSPSSATSLRIPGYLITALLYKLPPLSLYRAKSPNGGDAILKVSSPHGGGILESSSRLRHEWRLFSESSIMGNIAGILRPTAFEVGEGEVLALVYPDTGLSPLFATYKTGKITAHPVKELLHILRHMRNVAHVLEKVHGRNIVHGNINSSTIFLQKEAPTLENLGSVTDSGIHRAKSTTVVEGVSSTTGLTPVTPSPISTLSDPIPIKNREHVVLLGGFDTAQRMAIESTTDNEPQSESGFHGSFGSGSYFGTTASSVSSPQLFHITNSTGLWEYKAPELSGRMNRGSDWRGDLYSFGVVMYELCVGILPFQSTDYLELVHKHIAEIPESPSELNFSIPPAVSEVILKLLQKNPEDRYQTAAGIVADLDYLITRLSRGEPLHYFQVGMTDTDSQFRISEQMYGRENDVGLIANAHARALENGGCAVVLVSGTSGVGKSRLVHEIRASVNERRGYFTVGKFDQYRRGIPFFSLIQCLQDLIRQLLVESDTSRQRWRTEAIRAVDGEVGVLLDVAPEIRLLIGPEYAVEPPTGLGPVESEARFKRAFSAFLNIFSQRGLVMFLDDLQWCSQNELQLIGSIASNSTSKHQSLLIVGGYRDNEVSPAHPLMNMIVSLKENGIPLEEIRLGNLNLRNVTQMISDTMHVKQPDTNAEVQMLGRLVHAKTYGNIFFVTQLLKSLYRSGHIFFDFNEKKWRFDLKAIQADELPETAVDLLLKQMSALERDTQKVLTVAACIGGGRLTVNTLAVACDKSKEDILQMLWPALKSGLIVPVTDAYCRTDSSQSTEIEQLGESDMAYRFLHDRVQQAAYSLFPSDALEQLHHRIGKRLLKTFPDEKAIGVNIYDVVGQYNKCLKTLSRSEIDEVMRLNLWAGKRALISTAFELAVDYIKIAYELVPEDGWKTRYVATFEISLALVEAYYSVNRYQESLALIDSCLDYVVATTEKVRMLLFKLNCFLVLGEYMKAINNGLCMLRLLGCDVANDVTTRDQELAQYRRKVELSPKEIRAVTKLAPTIDETFLLIQEVFGLIILPIYMTMPDWLEYTCFLAVGLSLEHGISAAGAYPIIMAGVLFQSYGGAENHARSFAYGKLAISIIERCKTPPPSASGVYEVFAGHLDCFHEPMSEVLKYLNLAVSTGLATVNVDYTMFASVELCTFGLLSGENLASVQSKFIATQPLIRKLRHSLGLLWFNVGYQLTLNLRVSGGLEAPRLFGEAFDAAMKEELATCQSASTVYLYHLFDAMSCFFFNRFDTVSSIVLEEMEPRISAMIGTFYRAIGDFMAAAVFASLGDKASPQQKAILERGVRTTDEYAVHAKSTFAHKALFLKAELHRNTSDYFRTLDYYEEAIHLAVKHQFLHEAALFSERCGMWLQTMSPRRAIPYAKEAHRLYMLWGADAKCAQLSPRFPTEFANARRDSTVSEVSRPSLSRNTSNDLTNQRSPSHAAESENFGDNVNGSASSWQRTFTPYQFNGSDGRVSTSSSTMGESSMEADMDLKFVLKASLVISEGSNIEEVIVSLMSSVLQAAGADYGVLMMEENGAMYLETVGLLSGVTILGHEALQSRADMVPVSIVNLVAGLGETIVKDGGDWRFESLYGKDPYFKSRMARSVLCMPISNQLRNIGVLYLENRNASHAFSSHRLELLNLLCTQAAVTLEKARLYKQMELAKKAAEEATAEKASFLANMSHEIRTPFNALLSCSIFLLDTQLSVAQMDYVETIRNSATLTLQIIDGILDYSKIEHGNSELENAPFSTRDCIESALQLIAEPASTKGLEIGFFSHCREIDVVYGDLTRFRQIIINLLGNAVKFTSDGSILVEMSAEKFASDDSRYQVLIRVKDTGIGIPSSAYDRLFRAFSQVDSWTRRAYGGTGLGLAISKKLVEMMGGKIWVESEEGVGTSFNFTIVCKAATQQAYTVDAQLKGKHCLIADPYVISSNSLAEELEYDGFQVRVSQSLHDTYEAVVTSAPGTFSIAFVDVSMDETLRIASKLQAHDADLVVVMLCRFGLSLPTNADELGISSFLSKPLQRSRLLQTMHTLLVHGESASNSSTPLAKPKEGNHELKTLGSRHPLKILLAEDNPINQKVALQHLKRMGYDADLANDGIEALEMCERAHPMYDVILMDVQMPRCDGIETSLRIAAKYPNSNRPAIVALSANATAADREICLRAGMSRHLPKPILPPDLAAALLSIVPLSTRADEE